MSGSDDELDYMSEDFLSKCVGNNDIRPGLSSSHSIKRKYEIEKKKKIDDEIHRKKMKPVKQLQEERLKDGMNTALDTSNKGYAMLQKMGFKPGMSLGKGGGIIEPITVNLKSDRMGLGWQQLLKEKKKKIEQLRKARAEKNQKDFDPLEYRARMSSEHNQKKIQADLNKSRKVCYDLDKRLGYDKPHEYWFWPVYTWDFDEDSEDDEDKSDKHPDDAELSEEEDEDFSSFNISREELDEVFTASEQLQIITSYLRATYLYCVWCCTEFEDNHDLENNCPGPTRTDHDE